MLLLTLAACDRTTASSTPDLSVSDLSAGADLRVACPGLDVIAQSGACATPGATCYPDRYTYCSCKAGQWACCGDARPQCPSGPPAPGGFCCPGAPPVVSPLSCAYDGGAACVCGAGFAWSC